MIDLEKVFDFSKSDFDTFSNISEERFAALKIGFNEKLLKLAQEKVLADAPVVHMYEIVRDFDCKTIGEQLALIMIIGETIADIKHKVENHASFRPSNLEEIQNIESLKRMVNEILDVINNYDSESI